MNCRQIFLTLTPLVPCQDNRHEGRVCVLLSCSELQYEYLTLARLARFVRSWDGRNGIRFKSLKPAIMPANQSYPESLPTRQDD